MLAFNVFAVGGRWGMDVADAGVRHIQGRGGEILGRLLGRSWVLLGGSWVLLGVPWVLLGTFASKSLTIYLISEKWMPVP